MNASRKSGWKSIFSSRRSKPNKRKRHKSPSLQFESLEERTAFVVDGVEAGDLFSGVADIAFVAPSHIDRASGTLLSTGRHILTAAHPFAVQEAHPSWLTVNFGPKSPQLTVSRIILHPEWKTDPANDIAILELSELAPASITRYDIFREPTELEIGGFTMVGWGLPGTGKTGQEEDPRWSTTTKRFGFNRFDVLDSDGKSLIYDFDDGTEAHDAAGRYYGRPDTGGLVEAMHADHDSGGPALIDAFGTRE